MRSRGVQLGIVVALLLLAGSSTPALGQEVDRSLVQPFRQAEAYLNDGEYERAAEVFLELYRRSPDTYLFFDRLLRSYEELKWYDEALVLVEERLDAAKDAADRVRWLVQKGRLHYLEGDREQADRIWSQAVEVGPSDENTYRIVYSTMADVRHFEGAIRVLRQGREDLGDETLFTGELAQLYSVTGHHADAMREYLQLLELSDRRLGFVQSRLRRNFEQEGALEASLPVVEESVQEDPLDRTTRELLGWMYLEAEMYAPAYNTYRAIDRLEQEGGAMLVQFADAAVEGNAFEVAVLAYEDVLTNYGEGAIAAHALAGRGRALESWADGQPTAGADTLLASALDDYQRFLDEYSSHPQTAEVLQRTARLYQDVLREYDEAERMLETIVARYPGSDAAHEATFDLGRLELQRGNLTEARLTFSRLVDTLRTGDLAERARYELALLHFYQGEFESAVTLASTLENNTSSTVANDAIELKLLIREHEGPDSLNTALQDYAEAQLVFRQGRYEDAIDRAEQVLATHAGHPISDRAQYLKARSLVENDRPEEAVDALRALAERYRHSPLADRSLYEAAELQERYGRAGEAMDTYMQLLSDFPASLFVPDARNRIRSLRNSGV